MLNKVLILDANQRSALAATRALGKRGILVIVADHTVKTLAGVSKYCHESLVYPSPYLDPKAFIESLKQEVILREIKIIFPMTDVTTSLVLKYREEFPGISIPFASFETYEQLSDKWQLYELARSLQIPVPETYRIRSKVELGQISNTLRFPVVLKPYRSRIFSDGRWMSAPVQYAYSLEEINSVIMKSECYKNQPFLIQEYVEGKGQGVFALYDSGRPLAFFAHRRLHEKPPSGGISVLSESVELNPYLCEITQKLFNQAHWHGIAMVEFKVASNGIPRLIEVNARFWGSLQLAIDSGMDFPWLLYQMAMGEKINQINQTYRVGVKSRWFLGDLDYLYLKIKNHSNGFLGLLGNLKAIVRFFNFFNKNTYFEVNRWDDLRPFLFELKHYFKI